MDANTSGTDDVGRLLERALHWQVRTLVGPSPNPSQAVYFCRARHGTTRSVSTVWRAAPVKLATGLIAAALLGAAGSAAATAATGSPSPAALNRLPDRRRSGH